MDIKVTFDNITVKEDKIDTVVKILMLKGEKGDQGDGENNVIEEVQVNGTALPVSNKAVNVPVPTVDSALNSTSENPVQNKVIYNALNDKVDNSDLNNYYQISEVDDLLDGKADASDLDDYYTKTVTDGLLNNKSNATDVGNISNLTTTDKTSVVNAVNELNAPQKWVSVGATASTNGERVWFRKSKNVFDNTKITGGYTASTTLSTINTGVRATSTTTGSANYFATLPLFDVSNYVGQTFTMKCNYAVSGTARGRFIIGLCDENGGNRIAGATGSTSGESISYTIPTLSTSTYLAVWFYVAVSNQVSSGDYVDYTDVQIEEGSSATSYEPYANPSIYIDGELFISG